MHLYTLHKYVQKINIFLISLYEGIHYCIAMYFPLFCLHQLFTLFEAENFIYQCKNSKLCLVILLLTTSIEPQPRLHVPVTHETPALPLFHQKGNNQAATLLLSRKPPICIQRN